MDACKLGELLCALAVALHGVIDISIHVVQPGTRRDAMVEFAKKSMNRRGKGRADVVIHLA
jgi:hypothetical protein